MEEKTKIPQGLVWIKGFLIFLIIGDILYIFLKQTLLKNLSIFGGIFGDIFIIVSLIVEILIIIGINKRNYKLYKLALIWFSLIILETLVGLITQLFESNSFSYIIGGIPYLLVMCLFLWYLFKRKDYFAEKDLPFDFDSPLIQKQEKKFKRGIILAIVLFMVIIFLPQIIDTYKTITLAREISGKDVPAALEVCESKEGGDKDYCIYKVVEMKKKDYDFDEGAVCEKIFSQEYKDSCYMLLYQCDKINDKNIKSICESFKGISEKIPPSNRSVSRNESNLTQRPS